MSLVTWVGSVVVLSPVVVFWTVPWPGMDGALTPAMKLIPIRPRYMATAAPVASPPLLDVTVFHQLSDSDPADDEPLPASDTSLPAVYPDGVEPPRKLSVVDMANCNRNRLALALTVGSVGEPELTILPLTCSKLSITAVPAQPRTVTARPANDVSVPVSHVPTRVNVGFVSDADAA